MQQSIVLDLRTSMVAMNKVMRLHWSARHRLYRIIHMEVATLLAYGKLIPPTPWTRVRIQAVRYAPRMLDYDGAVACLKPAVDALKTCRVMVDDTWDVTGPWDVSQARCPGKVARWEIRVERVD